MHSIKRREAEFEENRNEHIVEISIRLDYAKGYAATVHFSAKFCMNTLQFIAINLKYDANNNTYLENNRRKMPDNYIIPLIHRLC